MLFDINIAYFIFMQRCVTLKEYMSIDLDKYHCPKCETICGPSISK